MNTYLRYLILSCALCLGIVSVVSADEMMMARIKLDFPETMLKLQDEISKQGYTLSRVQRVDIGLTKSGYKTDKYRLIFYGKTEEVKYISNKFPELIPYLPLKLALFAEAGDTMLIAANPVFLAPNASNELKQYLLRWEYDLQKLLAAMKATTN